MFLREKSLSLLNVLLKLNKDVLLKGEVEDIFRSLGIDNYGYYMRLLQRRYGIIHRKPLLGDTRKFVYYIDRDRLVRTLEIQKIRNPYFQKIYI